MTSLLHNMLPAIFACLAGFFLSKGQRIDLPTVGRIIIYCISPTVIFGGVLRAEIGSEIVALPLATFILGSLNSVLAYAWARRLMDGSQRSQLVASSASSANTLYFGFGLAVAVLPPANLPLFLLACVGFTLSEAVWGYYFLARSAFSMKEACKRVARLPVIYAIAIGVLWRTLDFGGAAAFGAIFDDCKGTIVLLGSMILGLALGQERGVEINPKLLLAVLCGRHLTFTLLVLSLIWIDTAWLHLFDQKSYTILTLFAFFPIANNTLTFATTLGLPTHAIGGLIVASNIFALALSPALLFFPALLVFRW